MLAACVMQLTCADLGFLVMCDALSMLGADSQVDSYPKMKALRMKVAMTPKIAEWLAKRPKTFF